MTWTDLLGNQSSADGEMEVAGGDLAAIVAVRDGTLV